MGKWFENPELLGNKPNIKNTPNINVLEEMRNVYLKKIKNR